ncbi:MAG: DNA internalization-related competence protein ComEC/Rec2 [Melioribacteraceae bacterium]|nr:DNA internalization-related competence protein ComEC/Rec2 [Melioribacteraceae bacterium]
MGIFIQNFIKVDLLILFFILSLYLIVFFLSIKKKYSKEFKELLILLLVFVIGCISLIFSSKSKIKYPFSDFKMKNVEVIGEIIDIRLIKEKKLSLEIKIDSLLNFQQNKINNHKTLCNIYESKTELKNIYNEIGIGNKILLKGTIIRPRNQRNPFEFDYEKYLNESGISFITNVYNIENIRIVDKGTSIFWNSIFQVRKIIDEKINLIYNKTSFNLLRGLILGDRGEIDEQINEDFINVGVVHILAVSGLNVGFIIIIFMFLFNRFDLYLKTVLTIIGLIFYMFLTGMEAPVVRATIMAIIILVLPLFGRASNSINSLSVASFLILLFNPKDLFNPSFQLSFSGILSLIIIAPYFNNKIKSITTKKYLQILFLYLATTLAAQIGTLPFTIAYFSKFSILSFIGNLVVIPLVGFIVGLGIASVIVTSISIQFAQFYSSFNELLIYLMLNFVHELGTLKFSSVNVKPFSLYDGILFFLCLGMILSYIKYFKRYSTKTIFVVTTILIFYVYEKIDNKELLPDNVLSVMAIDVGQGDSFLVKFPNNTFALIDAGNADNKFDNGEKIIIPLLNKLGIDKINYAFISHIDSDHFMGLLSLINENRIEKIYKPKLIEDEKKDFLLEKFIKSKNTEIVYYKNEKIKIGNVNLYVLNHSLIEKKAKSINDKSGLFKLVYGKNSILFTGDLGLKMEKIYVDKYNSFLESDVLKVGHHGSKTSSGFEFIKKVRPKYALISAGLGNKFNHPNIDVIKKLKSIKAEILRTDLSGAILLHSNGNKIIVQNWKNL